MGPTGSGKSTFIEALAGKDQSLGISKDQLAGFTQDVTSYTLLNAKFQYFYDSYHVQLIDTPGFSDSKISELEIITKVKNWMSSPAGTRWMDFILYLCPITDTRVPGSKRRTVEMLHTLLDIKQGSAPRVTIITTMWDSLVNPHARDRAEKHFAQLRDDVWKEVVNRGGNIARFHNTQESALEALKVTLENPHGSLVEGRKPLYFHYPATIHSYFPPLYEELLNRVNTCQQEIELLQMDVAQLTTNPDPELAAVVIPRIEEIERDLAKFLNQLAEIGAPPEGFAYRAASRVWTAWAPTHRAYGGYTEGLVELKVLNGNRGTEFVISCWPDLHPKAKFIIFDNLVKLINTRQQEDRSHCLDPLRQVITLTSSVHLEWKIRSCIDDLNKDREKLRWKLEHYSPPPPEFAKVQTQLVYRYLLDDVNTAKGVVQIFQDALNELHGRSDDVKKCKAILKAELAKAKDILKELALALIEFGIPLKIMSGSSSTIENCLSRGVWHKLNGSPRHGSE